MKVGDTVYVTKWGLSDGLIETEVTEVTDQGNLLVRWPHMTHGLFVPRRYVCASFAEAECLVVEMAERKLASLERQRAKLEKIRRGGAIKVRKAGADRRPGRDGGHREGARQGG